MASELAICVSDLGLHPGRPSRLGRYVRAYVDAGGLISYAPNLIETWRRAASYVDKILRGERPADLPVEQPTRFEFVVNLKAAKLLNLSVPPSILVQATEVID